MVWIATFEVQMTGTDHPQVHGNDNNGPVGGLRNQPLSGSKHPASSPNVHPKNLTEIHRVNGVIGYIRVSTGEQEKRGSSLQVQEDRLRAFAGENNLTLHSLCDETGSGMETRLEKRP